MAKSPEKSAEIGLRKTMGSLGLEELEAVRCLSEEREFLFLINRTPCRLRPRGLDDASGAGVVGRGQGTGFRSVK